MKRQSPIFAFTSPYKKKALNITFKPNQRKSSLCTEIEELLENQTVPVIENKKKSYELSEFDKSPTNENNPTKKYLSSGDNKATDNNINNNDYADINKATSNNNSSRDKKIIANSNSFSDNDYKSDNCPTIVNKSAYESKFAYESKSASDNKYPSDNIRLKQHVEDENNGCKLTKIYYNEEKFKDYKNGNKVDKQAVNKPKLSLEKDKFNEYQRRDEIKLSKKMKCNNLESVTNSNEKMPFILNDSDEIITNSSNVFLKDKNIQSDLKETSNDLKATRNDFNESNNDFREIKNDFKESKNYFKVDKNNREYSNSILESNDENLSKTKIHTNESKMNFKVPKEIYLPRFEFQINRKTAKEKEEKLELPKDEHQDKNLNDKGPNNISKMAREIKILKENNKVSILKENNSLSTLKGTKETNISSDQSLINISKIRSSINNQLIDKKSIHDLKENNNEEILELLLQMPVFFNNLITENQHLKERINENEEIRKSFNSYNHQIHNELLRLQNNTEGINRRIEMKEYEMKKTIEAEKNRLEEVKLKYEKSELQAAFLEESHKKEIEILDQKLIQINEEKSEMINKLERERSDCDKKLIEILAREKCLEKLNEMLKVQNNDKNDEIQGLKNQIIEIQYSEKKYMEKISQDEEKYLRLVEESKIEINKHLKSNEILERTIKSLKGDNLKTEKLKEELEKKTTKIDLLTEELKNKHQEIAIIKKENDCINLEKEKRITILESEVVALITELDKTKEQLKNQSELKNNSHGRGNQKLIRMRELMSEFKDIRFEINEITRIINETNDKITKLRQKIRFSLDIEIQRACESLATKIKLQKLDMENSKHFYEKKIKNLMASIKRLRSEKIVFVEPGDSDVWNVFPDT